MKKGFTFQQMALILLGLLILVSLIVIILTQRDQIANALGNIFDAGSRTTEGLGNAIDNLLN